MKSLVVIIYLMTKLQKAFFVFLNSLFLLTGLLILSISLPKFEIARGIANLYTPDGQLESFALVYANLRYLLILVGLILLLGGIFAFVFHKQSTSLFLTILRRLQGGNKQLWLDAAVFLKTLRGQFGLKPSLILLGITLIGFGIRLALSGKPVQYDEAYTYLAFASRPLNKALSDYHLPNNHLLHTLFVHLSTRLLGEGVLAIRLPALMAGGLLIPAAYLLGSKLYNKFTGYLSAMLVAVTPILVDYSINARGYTLVALFTLLTWCLGICVTRHANSFAWVLIGLVGACGFYTVPVFLYPFGILFTWLLLNLLFKQFSPSYSSQSNFFIKIFIAGTLTVILTAISYLPVILSSGTASLFGNVFVQSLSWSDFIQTVPHRLNDTWQEWTGNVSLIFIIPILVGLAISIILHRRISTLKIPFQLASVLFLIPVLLIQRPNPWAKVWLAFLPIILVWAAAGLVGLLDQMMLSRKSIKVITAGICLVLLIAGLRYTVTLHRRYAQPGTVEQIVHDLAGELQAGDVVISMDPVDIPLQYYWRVNQLDPAILNSDNELIDRAFVVVHLPFEQTLEGVLTDQGIAIDNPQILQEAELVEDYGSSLLYVINAD